MGNRLSALALNDNASEDEGSPENEGAPAQNAKDSVSMVTEWRRIGNDFHSQDRADKLEKLPEGVYEYVATMTGWYLKKTGSAFEFPFNVYNANQPIIDRVVKHWIANGGNLGILMNGLRGAGKTLTAQLLGNRLIQDYNLPVLVVRGPIPLQDVFDAVQQDLMVIFDEFEKSHEPKHQQALLSTIDGMSRSEHNRLIIFTTNSPTINENFRDRPSRIHYQFEFQKIADEVIEGLIQDWLPQDLMHFKGEIYDFLHSRSICTIDIVKAVLTEVKTFREGPREFEPLLNVSKGEPPSFRVVILNPDNTVLREFDPYFRLDVRSDRWAGLLMGNRRAVDGFVDDQKPIKLTSEYDYQTYQILLLAKCEEENCWLAELGLPFSQTFYSKYSECYENGTIWIDNRPDNWGFPFNPQKMTPEDSKALEELFERVSRTHTLYGTGEKATFKIQITPNKKAQGLQTWKISGGQGLKDLELPPRAAKPSGEDE